MKKVKLAVVGVGNCASSLIQGIEYYRHHHNEHSDGIMQPQINGWRPQDIKIVAAFDIANDLSEKIFNHLQEDKVKNNR